MCLNNYFFVRLRNNWNRNLNYNTNRRKKVAKRSTANSDSSEGKEGHCNLNLTQMETGLSIARHCTIFSFIIIFLVIRKQPEDMAEKTQEGYRWKARA